MADNMRPTKKQKELLGFIEVFIKEHGYSPSYREIMSGLGYSSVATVALHVNNLINRGHLRKRDRSARSLEITGLEIGIGGQLEKILEREEKWLIDRVHAALDEAEKDTRPLVKKINDVYVLIGALHVLGLQEAARSFIPRLAELKSKSETAT